MRFAFSSLMAVAVLACSSVLAAQSHPKIYAWDGGAILEPDSSTSRAITGPIRIGREQITFNGKPVPAKFLGRFRGQWNSEGQEVTASIYRLSQDPGSLRQHNTLCGSTSSARFFVVWEAYSEWTGLRIEAAAWSSISGPIGIDSPGLCGTFAYVT